MVNSAIVDHNQEDEQFQDVFALREAGYYLENFFEILI